MQGDSQKMRLQCRQKLCEHEYLKVFLVFAILSLILQSLKLQGTLKVYAKRSKTYRTVVLEVLSFTANRFTYSETLNNEYIERINQMSYSSLSDNEMLQIFTFFIK